MAPSRPGRDKFRAALQRHRSGGAVRHGGRDLSYKGNSRTVVYFGTMRRRGHRMKRLFRKLSGLVLRRRGSKRRAHEEVRSEFEHSELEEHARSLETCTAKWKGKPGVLLDVSGAGLAAIVSYRRTKSDDLGFRLEIEVDEPLMVPEGLRARDTVELRGNWKNATFDEEKVSLPGSFSIYFGERGVERVREFWGVLPTRKKRRPAPRPFFGMLQQCCRVGRPGGISEAEFQKRLKMFGREGGVS